MAELSKICKDFQLAVWDLVFDPDDVGDLVIYEKHLEDCPKCAGAYGQVKAIADELKQVKLPEPSKELPAQIKARLDEFEKHEESKVRFEVRGQRHPHQRAKLVKFLRYATAASVLAAIFVLLLIFAPSQTLPEAVASAAKIHEEYLNGTAKVLMKMDSLDQLNDYCRNKLALPVQAIPKVAGSCSLMCCCDCASVCNCPPEHCEVSKFTNKGAYLVFIKNAKPISLFVVKDSIKFPDYAKRSM
ncbi:hypothetical protein HY605_04775, partial [Candidatus Peregrinibacteria bacterium]|nr:hypothetical protein [Candidatus Peregrinibacteria bacterium]